MSRQHADDQALRSTVQTWLEGDAPGREILRLLVDDPATGATKLLQRLVADDAPPSLAIAVRSGEIGKIVNVASVQALNYERPTELAVSPAIAQNRLELGWNLLVDVTVMLDPEQVLPTELDRDAAFARAIDSINGIWGTDVHPPRRSMASADMLDFFTQRIAAIDPGGAAIFRLGGMLRLWWQFKGRDFDEREVWSWLDQALTELDYSYPGATARVHAALQPLRPGMGENDQVDRLTTIVGRAIAG